ncbi:MAG: hypothetical protein ACFE9M_07790 [Promethearchaeota archaeon]
MMHPFVCGFLGIILISIAVLLGFLESDKTRTVKTLLELLEVDFYEGLNKLLAYQNIISMSGESGTGNSTLLFNYWNAPDI